MKLLILALAILPLSAREEGQPAPGVQTSSLPAASDPVQMFTRGTALGHVGDDASRPYRRLIQRTIMLDQPRPPYGAILTFDDQLTPALPGDSSAMEVAKDLARYNAKAFFFANVPDNSKKNLEKMLAAKDPEKAARDFLARLKLSFVKTIRSLLKLKKGDQFICEVFNHSAFHQDMTSMKAGTPRFKVCLVGIRFIEECLDSAYALERPKQARSRYFRFPFLHVPSDSATRAELNLLFTELGLLSLGETQDSKDVLSFSPDLAYDALIAAQNNQRFSPDLKAHGSADQPIALFHTRSWSKIKTGVIKAIAPEEKKAPAPSD